MVRSGDPVAFAEADDRAVDEIDLRAALFLQVLAHGRFARGERGSRPDQLRENRFRIEPLSVRRRNAHRLIDQRPRVCLQLRVGCKRSDRGIQERRQRVDGHVDKQLFPQQMPDAVAFFRVRPGFPEQRRDLLRRRAVAHRGADVRHAGAGMVNLPRRERDAVVLGGTEQDARGIGKLPHDFLVSHSVLKGKQQGIRSDHRAVCLQCRPAEQVLDEQDHQVISPVTVPGKARGNAAGALGSVGFPADDPVPVDGIHHRRNRIVKGDGIAPGKHGCIETAHGSGTENGNFHHTLPSFSPPA